MNEYKLIKFTVDNIELDVSVSPNEETVWLTEEQIATLFGRNRSVISRHINNIYKEGELDKNTSVHFLHISKNVNNPNYRPPKFYNLDVIISVGYRVKSKNGILFRKWANNILKEYLLKGFVINENRSLVTNENYINLINRVESIDRRLLKIESSDLGKKEVIFFDGKFFDAKSFLASLFHNANKSIILIDPYADIKTLDFFKNKKQGVIVNIFQSSKAKLSISDIDSFNQQYGDCSNTIIESFHDRFIIIDDVLLYHVGASLNYAGKKAFAITLMSDENILKSIKSKLNK